MQQHRFQHVAETCRKEFGAPPKVAVILGSGVGGLKDGLTDARALSYERVGLPKTSVHGHAGTITVGLLGEKPVVMLGGRKHSYEGDVLHDVVCGVRAMAAWGVEILVMTSAVGSLSKQLSPGDLVRVTDHINLMGINPLVGPNLAELGPRFPDMSRAYDPELGAEAEGVAAELGVAMGKGVYAAVRGPSFETPAEVRMLHILGASVVGMSVVPETIAAVHAGMRVLTIAIVSNEGTGLSDETTDHDSVTETVGRAAVDLIPVIARLVSQW